MSTAGRLNVLIADFLDETLVESPILEDLADLTLGRAMDESELTGLLPEADAVILFHDVPRFGEPSFQRAGRCRCLVRAGVGFNNVDLDAATRRGVQVCNVPDYGTEEVADHAIMFLLALVRRLPVCRDAIREGLWNYTTALGAPRLRGKTLGLIGCGRIGAATALRAKAFGLDVVFFDPHVPEGVDKALGVRRAHRLETLLEESDFVSLHCYLDDSTRHILNAAAIARMKPGAIVVNTARGGCIDGAALLDGLESGLIGFAGLDVVEVEPLVDDRLRNHPRVLLTPHSAFYSVEGFIELRSKAAREVRRILLGEPPRNPVNRPGSREG